MAEIQAKPAAEGKPADSIFRQKSMDRVSSPEALDDYIRVTTPSGWILLIALAVLLAGVLAWIFIGSRGAAAPISCAEFKSLSAEQQKQTLAGLSGPEIYALAASGDLRSEGGKGQLCTVFGWRTLCASGPIYDTGTAEIH